MPNPFCATANRNFYLGNPWTKFVQLVVPDGQYTIALDQGRVDHGLLGGYHSVQRTGKIKRAYGLAFSALGVDSADQIVSILYGLLGPGPWYFIDPAWRNHLASHVSGAGGATQTSAGFIPAGAGTVAYSATITPPASAPLSGVQAWTGLGTTSELWLGATAAQLLETSSLPACRLLPQTFAVWLRSSAGTPNVAIDAYFNDVNGAYVSSLPLAATNALTTSWQRYAATLPAASIPATAVSVGYALRCTTAATAAIYVAAADVQFVSSTVGTLGTSLPPWVLGLAVPKVLATGTPPANAASVFWRRNHGLSLVEAA